MQVHHYSAESAVKLKADSDAYACLPQALPAGPCVRLRGRAHARARACLHVRVRVCAAVGWVGASSDREPSRAGCVCSCACICTGACARVCLCVSARRSVLRRYENLGTAAVKAQVPLHCASERRSVARKHQKHSTVLTKCVRARSCAVPLRARACASASPAAVRYRSKGLLCV